MKLKDKYSHQEMLVMGYNYSRKIGRWDVYLKKGQYVYVDLETRTVVLIANHN